MWVTASGVPMVKAPFKTPVRNATPPLHPVWLFHALQTKSLVAWWLGIAATTMIVTSPPTTIKTNPMLCSVGRRRLPKMQVKHANQVMQTNAT